MSIAVAISDRELLSRITSIARGCGHSVNAFSDIAGALSDEEARLIFAEWTSCACLPVFSKALRVAVDSPLKRVVILLPLGEVTAMYRLRKAGAADCLFYPVVETEIRAEIDTFLSESDGLAGIDASRYGEIRQEMLVGENPVFKKCLEDVKRAARSDAHVLLTGETGTGKEMVAKAIHRLSRRSGNPYLAFNCRKMSPDVFATELFGSRKGAFTGAQDRIGRFEAVGAGVLLLDEIAEANPASQASLLRAIDEGEFQRLGENRNISFNGRLICATLVNLEEAVDRGLFRADLLNRINQLSISLPSLRERPDDIPILARRFLRKHANSTDMEISRSTMKCIESYSFPGNVRELENTVVSAISRAIPGRVILPQHLPEKVMGPGEPRAKSADTLVRIPAGLPYTQAREHATLEVDRLFLEMLRKKHGDNASAMAREAGIDRATLAARLSKVFPKEEDCPDV